MPIAEVFPSGGTGGTTTTISDGKAKLVAQVDFSTFSNVTYTDGDYVLNTTAASQIPSITMRVKNTANNVGGSIGVSGGKIVANCPTTITSQYGYGYWATTTHSPMLAFDMRQFAEILGDTTFSKYAIIMKVEGLNPFYTAPYGVLPTNIGNSEIDVGFTYIMDPYWSNGTAPPRLWGLRLRSDANAGMTTQDGQTSAWGHSGRVGLNSFGYSQSGPPATQFKLNPDPYKSLYTTGPTSLTICTTNRHCDGRFGTATLPEWKYTNTIDLINNQNNYEWDPTANTNTGAQLSYMTNDVWATFHFQRTSGTGSTNFGFQKVSFYIVERSI